MAASDKPSFPITVTFIEDGDTWVLDTPSELECNLEWFDSRDPEENATITDSKGRKLLVVVEKLELKICQLA